jgi:hypothetical protein
MEGGKFYHDAGKSSKNTDNGFLERTRSWMEEMAKIGKAITNTGHDFSVGVWGLSVQILYWVRIAWYKALRIAL